VKHDGRLNLLVCLSSNGPLSVVQLAARIGESVPTVRYWVRLLDSYGLVEALVGRDEEAEEPSYVLTLDEHPDWVREAIAQHRPRAI
jgi:predicted transcriptional regulator